MILYRCFAWSDGVPPDQPDGPLWFPRPFQGDGRHDNPAAYGCLYLADRAVSAVVEQFAPFRGQRLIPSLLRRRGLPLALARLELADHVRLIDLDDPAVLVRERLRPSQLATRTRSTTQAQALGLFRRHRGAAGLRWWSTWEGLWINCTLFDRSAACLQLLDVEPLTLEHPVVVEASAFFGLRLTA